MKNSILAKSWLLGLTILCAQSAHAIVPNGHFKGEVKESNETINVMIHRVWDKPRNVYEAYAIMTKEKDSGLQAGVFLVEEVRPGFHAWIQLFQTKDGLLATDLERRATYQSQVIDQNKDGKKVTLTVSPTTFGKQIGAYDQIEIKTVNDWGWAMAEMGKTPKFSSGDSKVSLQVLGEYKYQINGTFKVGSLPFSGSFQLGWLNKYFRTMRGQTYDSESGFVEEKEMVGVLVYAYTSGGTLFIVRLPAGEQSAWNSTARLTE